MSPGICAVICGFPSVFAPLRKLNLEMASRLKLGNSRAARVFRSLCSSDRVSFEHDGYLALDGWLLLWR